MNELTTIDLETLDTVNGGEAGPNQISASGKLSVQTPVGVSVSGEGQFSQSRTDYAQCLDTMRSAGANFQQMSQACGLPPGAGTPPAGAGQ
jgi:hypothetical protein